MEQVLNQKLLTLLPLKAYTNMQTGLITESAVSFLLLPDSSCQESLNFHFDKIGSATVRKGITLIGSNLGSVNNQGMFEYRDGTGGTNNWLVAFNNGQPYRFTTSWTAISGGTFNATNKIRTTQFLGFLWAVDGANVVQIWNGTSGGTFVTTGNAASGPSACSLIENFRSRVWIASNATYPSRIFFSSIPSAAATPVVTWNTDPVTGNWIDIAPQDGEILTGLKRAPNALLAFKTNHIYEIYSINQTQPDPTINVGTYSAESIVEGKDGIYFHHSSGFYKYYQGSTQEISRPIIDIIQNIPSSQYGSITGWKEADGDHVCWSLGNVSYRQKTYSNLVVRYTISTQVWTHYVLPSPFVAGSSYNDGTTLFAAVMDNLGNVFKWATGKNDNGTAIHCSLVHNVNTFDGSLSTIAHINKIMFSHENLAGFNLNWATTDDIPNDWSKKIGDKPNMVEFDTFINNANVVGRGILFRVSGAWSGTAAIPGSYNGYEIMEGWSEQTKF
jgi:hypothetical protein